MPERGGMELEGLRGALIGYGFIGCEGHVPAYLTRTGEGRTPVEIAAVADKCEARRALVHQKLPRARVYPSAEALFAAERGRVDFVDICTPPCDHAAVAHQAFDLGLHVLCEKPLTTSREEAGDLLVHARRAGRVIFPCHNHKHSPMAMAIRDIIDSGRIGRVRGATLSTYRTTHARGVPEWNADWRRHTSISGGGIAMDHGSHSFYLTFEWMGGWPTAISAEMTNDNSRPFDTEDNFSAVLTFPSGLAQVHLTWTAGVRKVLYTIQGELGAITVEDDELQLTLMQKKNGPAVERRTISSEWMDASHRRWFNAMFDQFLTAIARGDFVGKEAQDAYRCVELITTGYRSAVQGSRQLPLCAPFPWEHAGD